MNLIVALLITICVESSITDYGKVRLFLTTLYILEQSIPIKTGNLMIHYVLKSVQ